MQNYKKWSRNITSIAFNKTPGKCPSCKGENTDYATRITNAKKAIGYGVIWCNDCKSCVHLPEMQIEEDSALDKDIPEDIKYKL